MTDWTQWLDEVIGPVPGGQRVLVLCRTQATLSMVRRWAARKGGLLGLEALTPQALARVVYQDAILIPRRAGDKLPWSEPLGISEVHRSELPPPETEMGRRIGPRPGLAGIARRWVQHVRAASWAGVALVVPGWLSELEATGWGSDEDAHALLALLSAAERRGRQISASASWDRVVALGFDRPAAALAPWEPALVRALTGAPLPSAAPVRAEPLRAIAVPDVVAEARVAALLASRDPSGTLVLVTQPTTARRLRDTLARNGMSCAWRDAEPLAVHELASVIRRAAPWFSHAPDPAIHASDLAFVLSRLTQRESGKMHPAAQAARARLLGADLEGAAAAPPDRRQILAVLERARLLDAPLSGWRDRLIELTRALAPHEPELAVACAGVVVRLEVLRACLEGRPLDEALGELCGAPVSFDPDDFDDVVATLLGDSPPAQVLAKGSTLGAIGRFLLACRIRVWDDPLAAAILSALRRAADWPVSPSHVHHALAGARDPGLLHDGVEVLAVDDWDGRPCRQLLVLDVHDHGLARRAAPDPLLSDEQIDGLGALAGKAITDERLAQVRRAAARAEQTFAIVTRRDAGGREVVPPIQLDLIYEPLPGATSPVPSYGWPLDDLPETRALVLSPVVGFGGSLVAEPPQHADRLVCHLAVQATAEWFRDGRGPIPSRKRGEPRDEHRGERRNEPRDEHRGGLAGERQREAPFAPPWVLPYLGHAERVPEASLPSDRAHSIPELFGPLAHCPYQAFARVILGVGEARELAQKLDPSEIEHAVHRALERVGAQARWRAQGAAREEKRAELVSLLSQATDSAFSEALSGAGPLSAARRASAEGRRLRWNTHWPTYVASRTLSPPTPSLERMLEHHPLVPGAVAAFRRVVPPSASLPEALIRSWVIWAAREDPRALVGLDSTILLRRGEPDELPSACAPYLTRLAFEPALSQLHQAVSDAVRKMDAWKRAPELSIMGTPFGGGERSELVSLDLSQAALKLGSQDVAVSGRIDRIDLITTPSGEKLASVVDYRASSRLEGYQFRREQFSLRDPQLLLYAMVIERAGRGDRLPEAFRQVRAAVIAQERLEQIALDPDTTGDKTLAPETWLPLDRGLLGWAARQLGILVDDAREGRWTLRPRSDACPMLSKAGPRCPVAPSCRLRNLPRLEDSHGQVPSAPVP